MTADPSPALRWLPHKALLGALTLALMLAASACGGSGGPSSAGETSTSVEWLASATAPPASIAAAA